MTLEYKPSKKGNEWSSLTFRTLGGGVFDFYIFYGPTFMEVIKQYQEVIGRPKAMPLWAHGLMSKSYAYKYPDLALLAI